MKTILAFASMITATSPLAGVQASQCQPVVKTVTLRTVSTCKPFVTCTQKLSTRKEQRVANDSCGRPYCYWVTVVTFRDVYNTGATRIYTRVVPA